MNEENSWLRLYDALKVYADDLVFAENTSANELGSPITDKDALFNQVTSTIMQNIEENLGEIIQNAIKDFYEPD